MNLIKVSRSIIWTWSYFIDGCFYNNQWNRDERDLHCYPDNKWRTAFKLDENQGTYEKGAERPISANTRYKYKN